MVAARTVEEKTQEADKRRAPESEGPCAGATDAVKVLPFTMLTPLLDVSNPAHVSPPASLSVRHHHHHLCFSP